VIWRFGYTLLLWCLLPAMLFRLYWRSLREPAYFEALGERFGRYGPGTPRAAGRKLIWIHAVSLGEVHAAKPLVDRLIARYPRDEFLLTQMTASGRSAALALFGGRARIVWLPYDYPFAVRAFLDRYRPDLGILVETEVWFNLIEACREKAVPLLLANARLSERSASGYEKIAPLASPAFASFAAVAAQSEDDARRLARLGARSVSVAGNLKFDVEAAPGSEHLASALRARFGARKVFLAASTRDGEEALILDALDAHPLRDTLTVIVPRHPQRFAGVAALLDARSQAYVRRSANRDVPDECRYFLGDSVGELAAYYRAADVAFVGGSLLDTGGQNFIEACAAAVPVLIGPSVYNFAAAAEQAMQDGAALSAADAAGIVQQASRLLEDSTARRAMGDAGLAFCAKHRGAADRMATIATRLLDRAPTARD
jgi:3-deoxy-D-manno-octulosonic-acid transferase